MKSQAMQKLARLKIAGKFVSLLLLSCLMILSAGWFWSHALQAAPTAQQVAQSIPQPVASHRADRGNIKVVWLQGTAYEMGFQHGTLLHDEIASMGEKIIDSLDIAGRGLGLSRLAERRSSPEIAEECRGLADATADLGMTYDSCMALAFGDVFQELFLYTVPVLMFNDGCAQFAAAGAATADGRLYHGGTLDNDKKPISYWINNSTVFVRQPNGEIPHVFIGVPGMVWPNAGLNDEGLSIALDTAHPNSLDDLNLEAGGSNVLMMGEIMRRARSLDDAIEIFEANPRMRANLILVGDGKAKRAGVFELLGDTFALRELDENGVVFMTNHFASAELEARDKQPHEDSSVTRFERFKQLLEPGGVDSQYGQIDPTTMVRILRDRTNPFTQEVSPLSLYDDNASPGGNGSMRQVTFDPERKLFWIAAGQPPVPENPFVCFSLDELLGRPKATACDPPAIN
ncbi:MAG: C45 family peptidase [Pegethrix bostrychoides GSE-TBD4-15B]|uniref:C45 family peptidase n=1 Tax=Pegethrix bostrychoides GSE-TBD4-15B TaxID=2839662 RepID=A0A951P8M2_9CYAN|nr:C45 family peptidase [Pegethrix bostrychoides GSE-TBD4-15B]